MAIEYIADNYQIQSSSAGKQREIGLFLAMDRQPFNYICLMSIKFAVYNTPKSPKSGKQLQHARLVSSGTQNMDRICGFISECSSLCSSDIKGAIEALIVYIGRELADGYSIDLEGLGHFSPSFKSRQFINGQGKEGIKIEVDGVNFRCSNRLKELVKAEGIQKVQRKNISNSMLTERKEKMLKYLTKKNYINIMEYSTLNGCTKYRAEKDLKQFLEEGLICQMGNKTHLIYVLP